jgi:S-formylglutathione hydrolase FrmB
MNTSNHRGISHSYVSFIHSKPVCADDHSTFNVLSSLSGVLIMKCKSFLWVFFIVTTVGACLASESRIELVSMQSQALGITKQFNIYLPEGYDENVTELYPVVYLFRGHEREWANRYEDASRNGRNIQDVADELYEAGLIGRMILVMPGVSSDDNAIPGLGVNFVDVGLAGQRSGLGTGRFEDFLVQDLVPYIDDNYRTLPSRLHRGLDGFSLGGYTSMLLSAKHPELFSSAGAYDGTMMWLDFDDPRSPGLNDDYTWLRTGLFDPAFGSPRDMEVMMQYNPANLIRDADAEHLALLQASQFMIHSAGTEALGNYNRSQHVVDVLAAQGIENMFEDIRLAPIAQHNWWYADEHMRITLPLHWERFENPINTMPLEIITPLPGTELAGQVEVIWSPWIPGENALTLLSYSRDEGAQWRTLATVTSGDTTYLWNTETVPDGTRYLLRVLFTGESAVAVSQTDGRFTINNPGNGLPDIKILAPDQWDVLAGDWPIRWFADDADGDELSLSMDYSWDNGATWQPVFENLQHTDQYIWNTILVANSRTYLLIVHCSDDSSTASDTSAVFEVFNQREEYPSEGVYHAHGNSNAAIIVHIVDPDQVTGDLYRLTFDDTLFASTVYDVLNVDTGEKVVEGATELDGRTEGPLFEGLRLVIADIEQTRVDHEGSGWTLGHSTLEANIYLPEINLGTGEIRGIPRPADYRITLFDHVADTSLSVFGVPEIPMMFTVFNLTEDRAVDIVYMDADNNQTISRLDELFFVEPGESDELQLTWAIFFGGQQTATPPLPNDEFLFRTLKPLNGKDVYEFRATSTPVELARIDVTPADVHLRIGEQQQFTAQGYDSEDRPMVPPITPIWWTDGGTISPTGLYTATAAGDFRVTASAAGSPMTGIATVHAISCDLPGNADSTGIVDLFDVISTINHILGLNPDPFDALCADCNGDGEIDILDALGIANVILGLGECGPGARTVSFPDEATEFLKALEPYFSVEDFQRFMTMVKDVQTPMEFSLGRNYPNPFNPSTDIRYQIADSRSPVHTTLTIFNILGQEIITLVNEMREPGYYSVTWDGRNSYGRDVATGVYFYRLTAGEYSAMKRMMLVR